MKGKKYIVNQLLLVIVLLVVLNMISLAAGLLCGKRSVPFLIISGVCFLALAGLLLYLFRVCLPKIRRNEQFMDLFATGYTIDDAGQLDCYLSKGTELALKKTVELLDKGKLLSLSKRQAQYLALQNQINPHFLYNTLEGIRSEAIGAGVDIVADMTETLAKFFRYTISRVESLVTVADEIENVKNYFKIQQFRFGDRLKLEIHCSVDESRIFRCQIPKLTLQPIVENAIVHGLEQKLDQGIVTISMTLTGRRLLVQVSDNGIGLEQDKLNALTESLSKTTYDYISHSGKNGSGIALQNVNNRIRLLFGEEYGIVIHSILRMGTDVVVTLPASKAHAHEVGNNL